MKKRHLKEIKELKGDPAIRGKALEVLGLSEDATPEEITMAFLLNRTDDPIKDHHKLTPAMKELFRSWKKYREREKEILAEKRKEAA